MRLIDADALIQAADKMFEHIDSPLLNHLTTYDVYSLVNNTPTVELDESIIQAVLNKRCMTAVANEYLIALHDKRPHGEWIKHTDNLYPEDSTEECPFCHEEQRLVGNDDNFCPNCGADMRGGTKMTNKAAIEILKGLISPETQALELAISVLEHRGPKDAQEKWILCSERLPAQAQKPYIVTIDYGDGAVISCERIFYGGDTGWNNECVIAWMPLPEPYKEANND